MYLKKVCIIVSLLVVFGFSLCAVESQAGNRNTLIEIETIYESIRKASPEFKGEESIVTFEHEGMTIVCSLTIPNTRYKPPIVISLNGFGTTRDALDVASTGECMFKRNSRILAENGIASLRIDFRGSGDSDGDYAMMSFSTQISDTLAAVDYIYTHLKHDVNRQRIGILGHSQGGLVGSVAAAKDKRIKSLVLWAPVSHAPIAYEGVLTSDGLKRGLSLKDGESGIFQLYINNQYINWDVLLGKPFFDDLYKVSPLAAICSYKNPLLVVVANDDPIIWPQPAMGEVFLTYHEGKEKLVNITGADHNFNSWEGPDKIDQFIYWATAWYIKTL